MLRMPVCGTGSKHASHTYTPIAVPDNDAAHTLRASPYARMLQFVSTQEKGVGIAVVEFIAANTVLGRYSGAIVSSSDVIGLESAYALDVRSLTAPDTVLFVIDARSTSHDVMLTVPVEIAGYRFSSDVQRTSWTRYINSINPGESAYAHNVEFVFDAKTGGVNVRTRRAVVPGEELLADYGRNYFYADLHGATLEPVRNDERSNVMCAVLSMVNKQTTVDNALRARITSPAIGFDVVVLRERSRSIVAVAVLRDVMLSDLFIIDVRNRLYVASAIFSALYEWALVNHHRYTLAESRVFNADDALAKIFQYEPTVPFLYYSRVVYPIDVHVANAGDLLVLPRAPLAIECPELTQQFAFPSRTRNRLRGCGDFESLPDEKATHTLRIALDAALYVGAAVETHQGTVPYVEYMCAFHLFRGSDDARAFVLEQLVLDYETRARSTSLVARIYVAASSVSLMTRRATLQRYRATSSAGKRFSTRIYNAQLFTRQFMPSET